MINTVALFVVSVPEFLVGYILIWMLAVKAGLFPSLSSISVDLGFADRLYVLFLPAMTLVLVTAAHMARMTRTAIVDVLSLPFVEMATLKGLPRWRVVFFHALPNAWAPIISVAIIGAPFPADPHYDAKARELCVAMRGPGSAVLECGTAAVSVRRASSE